MNISWRNVSNAILLSFLSILRFFLLGALSVRVSLPLWSSPIHRDIYLQMSALTSGEQLATPNSATDRAQNILQGLLFPWRLHTIFAL